MPKRSVLIRYTKKADKFFRAHEDVRQKYEESIKSVILGTGKADVKRITGKQGVYYRMRIGDYRIVYALIAGSIVAADAY